MSFYFAFNGVDLTELVEIKDVEVQGLPIREVDSIDIWDRVGSIFNSCHDGERTIKVNFLIYVEQEEHRANVDLINEIEADVKKTFHTKEPAPLFLGNEEKYINAIFTGEYNVSEIAENCLEGEINFICFDPLYYSVDVKQTECTNGKVEVENGGSESACPMIEIGFSKDAQFVNITNETNKQKLLIGKLPFTSKPTKKNKTILRDTMESTEGWTVGTAWIDTGRNAEGTLTTTESGAGLTVGSYGTKSDDAWYGVSARKSLSVGINNFTVRVRCSINSTGINGDPYHVSNKTDDDKEMVKTYYLKPSKSCIVRASKSTKGKKLGTITRSYKITKYTTENGWVKFTYKSKTGYVKRSYLKLMAKTKSVTGTAKNFVTLKSTAIRTSPRKSSKNKYTIPTGKVVRCLFSNPISDPDKLDRKYYKLAKKYNGHTGYVAVANLVQASDAEFEWEEELDTADDKQGILEIYGYTSEGTKLFKMMMCDESAYYEHVYPEIFVGSTSVYSYQKNEPAPNKKVTSNEKDTITTDYLLSGVYGSLDKFYGELKIVRFMNQWAGYIEKIVDDKAVIHKEWKKLSKVLFADGDLDSIVIYMGAIGDKPNNVSISHIEIKSLDAADDDENYNVKTFEEGDYLSINCEEGQCYLNGEPFYDIDVGSEFIELEEGNNSLNISSDDNELNVDILFNERWL